MKLTNKDISDNYRDIKFYVCKSSIVASMAYWITAQNPNPIMIIRPALSAFDGYVSKLFRNPRLPEKFTFDSLNEAISEEELAAIPEILELNAMEPDFIDLFALARNVVYMILREHITQDCEVV